MTEPDAPLKHAESTPSTADETGKTRWPQWALAILLTTLVCLSAAALLGATFMELMFDSTSAWIRVFVLLPVLLIASYLLGKLWWKLFQQRNGTEK